MRSHKDIIDNIVERADNPLNSMAVSQEHKVPMNGFGFRSYSVLTMRFTINNVEKLLQLTNELYHAKYHCPMIESVITEIHCENIQLEYVIKITYEINHFGLVYCFLTKKP